MTDYAAAARGGEGKGAFPNSIRFNARTLDEKFLIRFRQSTNDSNAKVPSFGFVPCQKRRLAISRSDPIVETLSVSVLYGNLLAVGDRLRLRTSEPDGRTAHFGPHCGEETNGESLLSCRRLVSALL